MEIHQFNIDKLIPYCRNPRKNDHAVEPMVASIQGFGFKIPVLARSKEVANLNPFGGSQEAPTGHSAQKPVELMRRPILNNSQRGQIIYDPFLGSGTTLMAAELTGRICYGLEIDPRYVELTIARWQKVTGSQAVLEGDDRSFEQVLEARRTAREAAPCPVLG